MTPRHPRSPLFPYTTLFRSRSGREDMAATAKLRANGADIDRFIFRAHTDAYFSIGQFFEENCNDHTLNGAQMIDQALDRKSTRLNSSHQIISYAVFCLKKKK